MLGRQTLVPGLLGVTSLRVLERLRNLARDDRVPSPVLLLDGACSVASFHRLNAAWRWLLYSC